jgi:hypothetical protein
MSGTFDPRCSKATLPSAIDKDVLVAIYGGRVVMAHDAVGTAAFFYNFISRRYLTLLVINNTTDLLGSLNRMLEIGFREHVAKD